ncbi:23S rRNA (adenine(2030)-N(6))-methyltransferase RlmJ [Beggiatoa leptomitoformis]|uniref:Ribosomal RNA large subunit methyltransferase J n=1 Tax=Beggiatoa leptomitoformis TaxID=288004 RepID=A0A2N9YAD4_9GAMM|nr:23S rRNA (adenine(2030)-N(6))-methyltransferase RlmJ [Beggiatoa leptomitoformis]ALG67169.1 23S rRNA (adenine(2030)-N(6))-methyltransferase RlmJ [Beggiatoa leptomitoformis]AUI67426.1 23S rRNA (adenine(2030)-N(6))-methyltransferase RlmJ [Beggiatoa leptomitoformis]
MNYRHSYHAGNFADVFKHITLIALLQHLQQKTNPFCYLETHAGIGGYDLNAEEARKTLEYQNGIEKLLQNPIDHPLLQVYQELIKSYNEETASIRYYPGSPLIAYHFLREQDRAVYIELHEEAANALKQLFKSYKHVAVHNMDGYQALKAFLPPKEKRGLVLIDPPFESPDEFTHLIKHIKIAYKRWATGTYAIWYPIKQYTDILPFHRQIRELGIPKILSTEFCIYPDDTNLRLNGCGLIIINPPWQLDDKLKTILPHLCNALTQDPHRRYRVEWLSPETP